VDANGIETLKSSFCSFFQKEGQKPKVHFFAKFYATEKKFNFTPVFQKKRDLQTTADRNAGEEEAGRKRKEDDQHDNHDDDDDDKESTTRRKEKDASDELPPEKIAQEETGDTRQVRAVERNAREIGEGVGEEEEEGESERAEVYAEDETIKELFSRAFRSRTVVCVY